MSRIFKKALLLILILVLCFSVSACDTIRIVIERGPSESASPPPPSATPTATETPPSFGETPNKAGSGNVLFDIYNRTALADLNSDGKPEELTFTTGDTSSTLKIGVNTYKIERSNLAQCFAVTDINTSDNIFELVFTDRYNESLADTEFPSSYLYWWNGEYLISMGEIADMKFDGEWLNYFNPTEYFDAHGTVMYLTRTQNFSDTWYMGHYVPTGTDRKLSEAFYVADVLFNQYPLELLQDHMILLKEISDTYFDPSYAVMWDYASGSGGYAGKPREFSDDIVAFVARRGEKLTITNVYGPEWFKLEAADGKSGWLKCRDTNVFGYWPIMGEGFSVYDLFDGIVVAG